MIAEDHPDRGCTVSSARLAVTGELVLASAPRTAAVLDAVLPSRPRRVLIDLADCSSIDGAGIGVLLRAHYRLRRDGGRLTLLNPAPPVRRVLHLTKADTVLDIRELRPVAGMTNRRLVVASSRRHG
ncbi:STAS domain-containing protein [Actinoplanes sp. NBC_00393]|uniref:STAS domain-containing protein n=1 Tax=Actinoplanes sp. NBC_00393 TaxID=2975953 RepID=UPI002E21BABA